MPYAIRTICAAALMALCISVLDPGKAFAQMPQSKFAEVNGVRLHYLIAGKGDPVVLLHGYAEIEPHVAAADRKTCRQAYRYRAGSARLRSIVRAT